VTRGSISSKPALQLSKDEEPKAISQVTTGKEIVAKNNFHSAIIGKDIATGEMIAIGDLERRSGLYILGKTGTGKTTLITNLIYQDIQHGHGLLFIDPHEDAIKKLITSDADRILNSTVYLDPVDNDWSFGINVLACENVNNLNERMETYTRAYNIFYKIWEDRWGD
jgi:RecA/RadA recombinase